MRRSALLILPLVALLTACGSTSSPSASSTEPESLSRDEVCARLTDGEDQALNVRVWDYWVDLLGKDKATGSDRADAQALVNEIEEVEGLNNDPELRDLMADLKVAPQSVVDAFAANAQTVDTPTTRSVAEPSGLLALECLSNDGEVTPEFRANFDQLEARLDDLPPEHRIDPSPSASATAEDSLVLDDLTIDCGLGHRFDSLEDAWAAREEAQPEETSGPNDDCEVSFGEEDLSSYALTDAEQEASETSETWESTTETDILERFYQHCASKDMYFSRWAVGDGWASPSRQEEFPLIKALCPTHPDREEIEAIIAEAGEHETEREAGTRFANGTYIVGEEIEPGTYASTTLKDGCYWERTDSSGNIIDNNFITSGRRAQVTIQASDYSFHTSNCGEWARQ